MCKSTHEKNENNLTYFGDPLCKRYIYIYIILLHVVFNLTMEWTPRALVQRRSPIGCSLIVPLYAHNHLSSLKDLKSVVVNLLGGPPSILKLLNIMLFT